MNQPVRAMWIVRLLVLSLIAFAAPTLAQSTRIQDYANNFGWTKLANGPAIFQFTAAQFPGYLAFSATNCVATQTSIFVGIGNSTSAYTSAIVRLDPNTLAVQAVIAMPSGAWLNNLALSPGKIWASDWATGKVYRVDLTSNAVDLTITTGFASAARGVVYGNGVVMVANQSGGTVHFYDATTGAVVASPVTVGTLPLYGTFDGDNFWVAVQNSGTIVKISGTSLAALATLSTSGTNPFTVFADGSRLYAITSGGTITVFDQVSNAALNAFQLETGSGGHFAAKVRGELWIAQHANNKVVAIDAMTGTYIREIAVGTDPSGICFNGYDVFSIDYGSWTLRRHNVSHIN